MPFKFKISFFIIFLMISNIGFSQKKPLTITPQRNSNNSIDFYYTKTNPGSKHVIITFKKLTNCRKPKVITKTIKGWSGLLFTLRPIDKKKRISYSYRYQSINGNPNAKIDSNFVYILPFKKGTKITASKLSYLGKRFFGNKNPKNWKYFKFKTTPNTTVVAIRKGIVIKVQNKWNSDTTSGKEYGYKSDENYILIEHSDGTFARYSVLAKNSIKIKVGDTVYPSTPIATTGSYDTAENNQLRIGVYYLDPHFKFRNKKENLRTKSHHHIYINPFYFTDKGITQLKSKISYTANFNQEIITKEMKRREKKKWKKKHKK